MTAHPDAIGRILAYDYQFKSGSDKTANRQTREYHPCVVLRTFGDDYYVVAPISHSKARGGEGHIHLSSQHTKSGGLDGANSFIERGEFNIVHRNNSGIQRNRSSGQILSETKLSRSVVDKLTYDFDDRFNRKALDLSRIMRGDDTVKHLKSTQTHSTPQPDTRDNVAARAAQQALKIKHRGGTLSLSGKDPAAKTKIKREKAIGQDR